MKHAKAQPLAEDAPTGNVSQTHEPTYVIAMWAQFASLNICNLKGLSVGDLWHQPLVAGCRQTWGQSPEGPLSGRGASSQEEAGVPTSIHGGMTPREKANLYLYVTATLCHQLTYLCPKVSISSTANDTKFFTCVCRRLSINTHPIAPTL